MPNPEDGKIFDSVNRPPFKSILSKEARAQVEITLEYLERMAQEIGITLSYGSYDELKENYLKNLSLIFTGLTPEEKAKEAIVSMLRSWGINPGAIDRMQVNGREVTLTRTEYDLLELFAATPYHLVTHRLAEKRFGWKSPGGAFSMNVGRINQKTATLGSDAPIQIVSIRTVGYRADPNPDISTIPSTSSASDLP